jgi:serine/threonine-protein kinase ULK4
MPRSERPWWAAKFASQEVTAALVTIMTGAKLEQLRGTAASCLARAARYSPAVLQLVLDRYGIKLLVTGLRDPSPKVQQGSLNLLNRGLGRAVQVETIGCGVKISGLCRFDPC